MVPSCTSGGAIFFSDTAQHGWLLDMAVEVVYRMKFNLAALRERPGPVHQLAGLLFTQHTSARWVDIYFGIPYPSLMH